MDDLKPASHIYNLPAGLYQITHAECVEYLLRLDGTYMCGSPSWVENIIIRQNSGKYTGDRLDAFVSIREDREYKFVYLQDVESFINELRLKHL